MDFNSKIIKSIGLEGKPSNHKIAVAMSGGVDSSVTAALLHKAGYYVFGLSTDEYNKCYVRSNKNSDVYLLNSNILYQLQTSPFFWGTKPNRDNELN